jgi:hypothetical protein
MKMKGMKREYRILALAIVIFVVGATFFFYDRTLQTSLPNRMTIQVPIERASEQTIFSNMPNPSAYKTFSYLPNVPVPIVKDMCRDTYIAMLIFKADLDYRKDPSRASINRAFPCEKNKLFQFPFSSADMKNYEAGRYYIIVADEGGVGAWYNPR